jgi:hypothetical protein
MSATCPLPPPGAADLKVLLSQVPVGTELIRFHSPKFRGIAFNPNIDNHGRPKRMEDPLAGARFSPFAGVNGINVGTLYAGTTERAAALESVFHELPHVPNPTYASGQLKGFALSRFMVKRALTVFELVNPQLRQVPVDGRVESLNEGELISSSPKNYPTTRAWARHFHRNLPVVEGLAWRPRLGGEGMSYVFFDGRASSNDFDLTEDAVAIDDGPGRVLIERIAKGASIKLIGTR